MKTILVCLLVCFAVNVFPQSGPPKLPVPKYMNEHVVDSRRLPRPPIFRFGVDSLQRFYFAHFKGFDSVLTKAINHGDTAKYIRVYFNFVIDKDGGAYDPHFLWIGSTQYGKSAGFKLLRYFNDDTDYYENLIKQMIYKMPFWVPGLANIKNTNAMVAWESRVENYIQFWVGINPPQY